MGVGKYWEMLAIVCLQEASEAHLIELLEETFAPFMQKGEQ